MECGRRQERTSVQLDVALEQAGRAVFAPALNLSASGIFMASDAPPVLGAHVRVVVSLPPDGVFVRMQGRVIRHASETERRGFAVVFEALDEPTREVLRSFVRSERRA